MPQLALYTFGVLKSPLADPGPLTREFHDSSEAVYRGDQPAPRMPRPRRSGGRQPGHALRPGLGRLGRVRRTGLVRQGPHRADRRPGRDPLPLDRPAPRLRRHLHRPAPPGAEPAHDWFEADRPPGHVFWWVSEGVKPTWQDGVSGWSTSHDHGSARTPSPSGTRSTRRELRPGSRALGGRRPRLPGEDRPPPVEHRHPPRRRHILWLVPLGQRNRRGDESRLRQQVV